MTNRGLDYDSGWVLSQVSAVLADENATQPETDGDVKFRVSLTNIVKRLESGGLAALDEPQLHDVLSMLHGVLEAQLEVAEAVADRADLVRGVSALVAAIDAVRGEGPA